MPDRTAPVTRRPRLTYANVMSTLAVVLALSMGTAYAAGLANNSVKSRHIAPKAVKAADLGDGSVGAAAVGNNAIGAQELADDAVDAGALANSSVGSGAIADNAVSDSEIAADSVGGSELENDAVTTDNILDDTITGADVKPGSISSSRMTPGVNNLLFDTGTIAFLEDDYSPDVVTSTSWPAGAPTTGAQLSFSWSQPPGTYDVATVRVRLAYEDDCTNTNSTPRGIDIKAVDADGRVISASAAQRTDGVNYNGNGFWAEQVALDGVSFRAPAANAPDALVDYTFIPLELADFYTSPSDSGNTARTVRIYFKTNSTNCDITVSQGRALVYRFADPAR